MNIVILKPIISEKSMILTKSNLFTFMVGRNARKPEIKSSVESQFGVKVMSVKTMKLKDEKKIQRGRRTYRVIPGFKKAIVELKKGQKISLFETEPSSAEASEDKAEVKEKKSLFKGTKVRIEKGGE